MEIDRLIPPALKPVTDLQLIQANTNLLDNGLKVYSINAGSQEMVKVDIIFDGGYHHQEQNCLANSVTKLITEGTKNKTALEISEKFDFYGSFIQEECGPESSTISLFCLNKYLGELIPLANEVISEAIFPEEEIEIYKENCKQRLAVNKKKNSYLSKNYFNKNLFGNGHPEGAIITNKDYNNLTRDLLVSYHKKTFVPENCRIIISGSVNEKEIEILNQTFGKIELKKGTSESKEYQIEPDPEKYHFYDKHDSLQAAVAVGKFLFNRTHPDYFGMTLLNLILGGYFGSRLMKNIREDKGYTYGIHSGIQAFKNTGVFFIRSEVKNEVYSEVLTEINKEIKQLQTTLIDETELNTARNFILGNFLRSFDGPFAMADRFRILMENNLDYNYYHNYVHTVKTITAKKLQELANRYLQTDDLYQVIVGKKQ